MAPLPSLRTDRRVLSDRRLYSSGPSFHAEIDFNLGDRGHHPYSLVPEGEEDDDDFWYDYDYTQRRISCCERWSRGDFTIVPENNSFLDIWDIIVITALFTTAFVVPFEVALYEKSPPFCNYMSRCIDIIFGIDIVLTFNVAYPITNPLAKDFYERAPCKIARQYMAFPFTDKFRAGWFWPDLATVFPWSEVHKYLLKGRGASVKEDSSVLNEIRLVRVLRLIRMFRLVRVVKLVKRWRSQIGFSSAYTDVAKCFLCTLLAVHWFACLWSYLGVNLPGSWLEIRCEMKGFRKEDFTRFEIYNLALYFCTMILTTVGLGDILPSTQVEIALGTATMLATGVMWAWVLASIVNVITNSDAFGTAYAGLMDDLNALMETRGVSTNLRVRLRKYLEEAEHVHRLRHQRNSVTSVTKGLQGELAVEAGVGEVCECVWYLRNISHYVLIDLSQYFMPDMFCPGEFLNEDNTTMVMRRGTSFHKGRVLVRDAVIGEDMILVSDHLRETWFPRALSFVEVMKLTRDDLVKVCERHVDFSRRIRRAQIKLAVWRAFIAAGKAEMALRNQKVASSSKAWSKTIAMREETDPLNPDVNGGSKRGFSLTQKPFQQMQMVPANWQPPEGGAGGGGGGAGSAELILELRALGTRIEESSAGLRRQLDKLDARINTVERKTARSKYCRNM
mmetsp:Transcript_95100/g.182821  ORF Transcript_95100/g.182821 Transcript_95100/m.182821 type:complete len:675 (+) Transcript_95100:73-2097(+)